MPIQITVRNVPEDVRDELAKRAAAKRQSMQEYVLGELERMTSRPSAEDVLRRVAERKAIYKTELSVEEILEDRDADRT